MGAAEKLACLERGLELRRLIYPRWVAEGRMREDQARREIKMMEDFAGEYRAILEKEKVK